METADAVVVGGGIHGTNIAFHLARRGLKKIILLEKTAIGAGASGKTGGLIGSHFGTEVKVRLAIAAMPSWLQFGETYETKVPAYDRCGRVWLVPPSDVDAMRGIVQLQRAHGSEAREIQLDEVRELVPQIDLAGVGGIAYEPNAGVGDALGATSLVAAAAQRAGADIRVGVAALAIQTAGGRVIGVETQSGRIAAPLVFNAANVWAPTLLRPLGVSLPIQAA